LERHTISVLLVDPESLVRFAIKRLIDSLQRFHVSWESGSMEDAIRLVEDHDPAFLITEVALRGPSGLELLLELQRRKLNRVKPVVLSQVEAADMVKQAFLAGAQGYIFKSSDFDNLTMALDTVASNRRYIPQELAHLADLPEAGYELGGKSRPNDPLSPLSAREREIFHLLANGLQNTVIAKKLFISPRTVETHRARVVRKLGLTSNGELIRFAVKHGLTIV
jgi:DNA-binding NarL/FixJ family response regulator